MNSSLRSMDRGTHLKVALVAAIASVSVMMVGLGARGGDAKSGSEQIARSSADGATLASLSEHSALR